MSIPSEVCERFRLEIAELAQAYGWKYLKSTHELKKQVRDIVFVILMSGSHMNCSTSVLIDMGFYCWSKSISEKYSQDAHIMNLALGGWWELITPDAYNKAVKKAKDQFLNTIVPLLDGFEDRLTETVRDLAFKGIARKYKNGLRTYRVYCKLEYVSHVLGNKEGQQAAIAQYRKMDNEQKNDKCAAIRKYKDNTESFRQAKSNGTYFVESDIMYMVDNKMIDIDGNNQIVFPEME